MLILHLLLLVCSPLAHAEDEDEFFERKIRPLLEQRCLECHRAPQIKGGLSLASKPEWLRGGAGGAVIVPGEPEQSRLIHAVRYRDLDLQMPPDSRLPEAEIALFEEWVRRGAHDPRAAEEVGAAPDRANIDFDRARAEHWSFKPLQETSLPAVQDRAWVRDEMDQHILAGLEAAGLTPAPEADRRTWLRRASFDLLGLPPTPEELEAFVADTSPDAFDREIERLLASPHYGERWGRRWLDLARYADSNGVDENLALAHAWRYRDYVVRAFNTDKPYDRFVMEQLAGDLLPPAEDPEAYRDQLTATGFLVLGPKMLAEQDKEKLVMDVIDEQLDVAGKAFLGLSIGCARCHDHKFDPIAQRDYYALAGIFRSTSTMANLNHVSRWREVVLATPEEEAAERAWRAAEEQARQALDQRTQAARTELHAEIDRHRGALLEAGAALAGAGIGWQAETYAEAKHLTIDRNQWGSKERPILRSGDPSREQYVEYAIEVPRAGAWQLWCEYASNDKRALTLHIDGQEVPGEVCASSTGGFHLPEQRWELVGSFDWSAGPHRLRFSSPASRAFPHLDRFALLGAADPELEATLLSHAAVPVEVLRHAARVFATASDEDPLLAPWRAWQRDGSAALAQLSADPELFAPYRSLLATPLPQQVEELNARAEVLFSTVLRAAESERARQHKNGSEAEPSAALLADAELERLRVFLEGDAGPFRLSLAAARTAFNAVTKAELTVLEARLAEISTAKPRAFDVALGVADEKPTDLPIHLRGSHLTLGPEAIPRAFLELFRPFLPELAPTATQSGRAELAHWLVDPRHPLTARVLVNRVWQGHFGHGLVRTASDFGLRGDEPTHPKLLDALARDFMRDGWSIKNLHRRVMRSSTYRMSTAFDEVAAELDPQDRLLWRFPRLRLDAEIVRDALLASSGGLDRSVGGTLMQTGNGDYVTNDQSGNGARYAQTRRSLYLPIIRNAIYELFSTFDYNDPSVPVDRRPTTVVAHQALWAMNSPLVREESQRLAATLLEKERDPHATDPARITEAYLRLFGRTPSADEVEGASTFLSSLVEEQDLSTLRAWSLYLQSLFASSEFLYID